MRTTARLAAALALGSVIACGDDGGTMKMPDSGVMVDMAPPPRVCEAWSTGTLDFFEQEGTYISWITGLTQQVDGLPFAIELQFYGGTPAVNGTIDLASGANANYSTCTTCLVGYTFQGANIQKLFYPFAGTVTFTEDPRSTRNLKASFSGVRFEEVTIDFQGTATSTPVANGKCGDVADFSADHNDVYNAWSCDDALYTDGTNCNCACAIVDPDCSIANAPVMGCTNGGDRCFNAVCATPPTMGDTCATAIPIALATPLNGNTAGALDNYDEGLDVTDCTNKAQEGPDLVYTIDLAASTQYTITLTNLMGQTNFPYDGSISLVGPGPANICDPNPITTCVEGADAAADNQNETLTYTTPANGNGTYYIIVDGFEADEGGSFTLQITSP